MLYEHEQRILFSTATHYARTVLKGYLHEYAVMRAADLLGGLSVYVAEDIMDGDLTGDISMAERSTAAVQAASRFIQDTADFCAKRLEEAGVKPGPKRDPRSKGTVWD